MKIVRHVTAPKKPKRPTWDSIFSCDPNHAMIYTNYLILYHTLKTCFHLSMLMALAFGWIGHGLAVIVCMVMALGFLLGCFALQWSFRKWKRENGV